MIVVRHAVQSDRGLRHERNEDRWFADPANGLYFVSDGMANEPTPQFVLEALPALIRAAFPQTSEFTKAAGFTFQKVVWELNEQVRAAEMRLRVQADIVGATLVTVLVRGASVLLGHVGDSRIYLSRRGKLEPLTSDHSLVREMLDAGQLTVAQALAVGNNGGPTRFIGMSGKIVADVRELDLQPGDRLLLCSDGLTEMLDDDEVEAILNAVPDLNAACQKLVTAANEAGGFDNVTVLLLGAEDVGNAA